MSFDQDINEQANISGADLAILIDELKSANLTILEQQARIEELDRMTDCEDGWLAAHDAAKRKETLEEVALNASKLLVVNEVTGFAYVLMDDLEEAISRMAQRLVPNEPTDEMIRLGRTGYGSEL